MIKIPFQTFLQSMAHLMKINAGWDLEGLGSNWIRFGNLSLQCKKHFGANSVFEASDAKLVKIFVASILAGLGSASIFIGRATDE